jgi:hypothetical protein
MGVKKTVKQKNSKTDETTKQKKQQNYLNI